MQERVPALLGLLENGQGESGIDRLRRIPGFDLFGSGILIGFADTGIAYSHPDFLYEDGSSRVRVIWDQTAGVEESTSLKEVPFGTVFGEDAIAAGTAPGDENGHGTYLAGIAAGREYGVAPQAQLAVVKLRQAETDLKEYYCLTDGADAFNEEDVIQGIRFLISYAKAQGMPLVVCLGVGTSLGSHTGDLPVSRYLENLAEQENLCIVTAVGNEGNTRHHAVVTLNEETREVEVYTLGESGFVLELYAEAQGDLQVYLISPNGETSPLLTDTVNATGSIPFLFDRTTVETEWDSFLRTETLQRLQLRFRNPSAGIWRLRLVSKERVKVDLWLPIEPFLEKETYFLAPDPEVTLCEPANASRLLAVGGYSVESGSPAAFSGRGYTANGRRQPSVLAPAVDMIGPFYDGGYIAGNGTSAASAFASGCVALLFEYMELYRGTRWYSPLNTLLVRNLFSMGANRQDGITYPNPVYGYGMLNLLGVFEFLRNL